MSLLPVVTLYAMPTSTAEAAIMLSSCHVAPAGSSTRTTSWFEASFSKHADILVFLLFNGHIYVVFFHLKLIEFVKSSTCQFKKIHFLLLNVTLPPKLKKKKFSEPRRNFFCKL